MEVWFLATVAAAIPQNVRNSLHKTLNSVLSIASAAYTRCAFGFPFATVYWIALRFGDVQ